jgi:hypothetical protein
LTVADILYEIATLRLDASRDVRVRWSLRLIRRAAYSFPGAALAGGDVVARLDLDDTSTIRKVEIFTGQLPPQDKLSVCRGTARGWGTVVTGCKWKGD